MGAGAGAAERGVAALGAGARVATGVGCDGEVREVELGVSGAALWVVWTGGGGWLDEVDAWESGECVGSSV